MVWNKGSADGPSRSDAGEPDAQTEAKSGAKRSTFDEVTDESPARIAKRKGYTEPAPVATPIDPNDPKNPYAGSRRNSQLDPIVLTTGEFQPVSSGTFGILTGQQVEQLAEVDAAHQSGDTVSESTIIRDEAESTATESDERTQISTMEQLGMEPPPSVDEDDDALGATMLSQSRERAQQPSDYERTEMVDPSRMFPPDAGPPSSDAGLGARSAPDTDPERNFDVQTDKDAVPLEAPRQNFELGEPFKRGGMAELYKARRRTSTGEMATFVIKKLLSHLATDEVAVERFKREAELTMMLGHPAIARTFEHGPYMDSWYIAMEWIDGPDLDEIINHLNDHGRQCPPGVALKIALEVAGALRYAHNLPPNDEFGGQVVHRDVNPANVIVTWDGRVKLLDFGLAKGSESANLTGADVVVGKLTYQPPEALSGAPANPQFDVYGLAMLLYELLAGHSAFGGMWNLATIVDRIRTEVPEPLVESVEGITPELSEVVARAMAKDPAERHPTMSALLEDLQSVARFHGLDRVSLPEFLAELFGRGVVAAAPVPEWPEGVPLVERTEIGVPLPEAHHAPAPAQAPVPMAPEPSRPKARPPRPRRVVRRPAWVLPVLFLIVVLGAIGALGIVFWDDLGLGGRISLGGPTGPQEVRLSKVEEIPLDAASTPPPVQPVPIAAPPEAAPPEAGELEIGDDDPMSLDDAVDPQSSDQGVVPDANKGIVLLRCRKGVVFVDKKKYGACPKAKLQLTPGMHRLEVRGPKTQRRKLTVRAGQVQKLDLTR